MEKRTIGNIEVNLIPVSGIRDEKIYISNLRCGCSGTFKMQEQQLFSDEKVDMLVIECERCRKQRQLYFDISSFFGVD